MATAEVLDFDRLLAPIPGDNSAGIDLRDDPSPISDYYTIRDARKAASDAERRIDQGDLDAPPPDWRLVKDRAVKVLGEKSKDLEIAAYLVEALVRMHGFAGVRDGFKAARGLLEQFWDHLYPADEDGDVEARFSHVLWLNGIDRAGTLIVPIAKLPLTADTASGEFTLTHYHEGQATAKIADAKARQKKIDEGAVTPEAIQRAVAATPPKFYADLVEDVAQSLEEFERFCALMSEKSGYDPPSSDLRKAINDFLDVVKDVAKDKLPKPSAAAASAGDAAAPPADGQAAAAPAVPAGAIVTRDDALQSLEKVAEFFRKTEPHSIIPYALEQVAAWGRMPLPDLLAELIPDEAPRKNLFKQVGIKPPNPAPK
jgi:type VI secretion system protein ImpA